jgi:hypothetical protein
MFVVEADFSFKFTQLQLSKILMNMSSTYVTVHNVQRSSVSVCWIDVSESALLRNFLLKDEWSDISLIHFQTQSKYK